MRPRTNQNENNSFRNYYDIAAHFHSPYYQYRATSFSNARVGDLLDIHLKKIRNRESATVKFIFIRLEKILMMLSFTK